MTMWARYLVHLALFKDIPIHFLTKNDNVYCIISKDFFYIFALASIIAVLYICAMHTKDRKVCFMAKIEGQGKET